MIATVGAKIDTVRDKIDMVCTEVVNVGKKADEMDKTVYKLNEKVDLLNIEQTKIKSVVPQSRSSKSYYRTPEYSSCYVGGEAKDESETEEGTKEEKERRKKNKQRKKTTHKKTRKKNQPKEKDRRDKTRMRKKDRRKKKRSTKTDRWEKKRKKTYQIVHFFQRLRKDEK